MPWKRVRLNFRLSNVINSDHNKSIAYFFFKVCCVVLLCVFTFWVPCCDVRYDFAYKGRSVRLYLQLFVRVLMFYLPYLFLFDHSSVQSILCCVFVLFFFVLCTLCCQFLWIVKFWLSLQYSLTYECIF